MGLRDASPRTRIGITVGALLLGLALPELALRGMLFTDLFPASWSQAARFPGRYASDLWDDAFWELHRKVRSRCGAQHPNPDPLLGWRKPIIDGATYRHRELDRLDGRRPIVLYGASFGACMNLERCFEELLAESELGATHRLVNYAVTGWGFDQTVVCFERTLEHLVGLDPIVVIAPVVESDFDRCLLTLREFPKPRFRVVDGKLTFEPPQVLDIDELLASRPPSIRSYAWRHVVFGTDLLPAPWKDRLSGAAEARREKTLIVAKLLERVRTRLTASGADGFFLLFHRRATALRGASADEQQLVQALDALGLPYVDTRPELREASGGRPNDLARLFAAGGVAKNHPSEEGVAVLFETLRRGLAGEADGAAPGIAPLSSEAP